MSKYEYELLEYSSDEMSLDEMSSDDSSSERSNTIFHHDTQLRSEEEYLEEARRALKNTEDIELILDILGE